MRRPGPRRLYRRRARGFTLLEMAVVVVAIGILAGLALERLLPLIGEAERVAFMRVQGQLQTALVLETAQRVTRGESRSVPEMADSNPMNYVLRAPVNYLGSYESPRHGDMPAGYWYFDEGKRQLVYRVRSRKRFRTRGGAGDRAEFRVRLAFRDRDGDGSFDPSADIFDGVWLEPIHSFRWAD